MKKIMVVIGLAAGMMLGARANEQVEEFEREDVYAIESPKERLEALRRKWPHAGDRVSMWEMPEYEDRFFEIDRLWVWCSEDKAARYGFSKEAVLEAIDMKIEPAIWYYNLACVKAVLGEDRDEAFEALEQAVAAGYDDSGHAWADDDFESITNDTRFAMLCETMEAVEENVRWPNKVLKEGDEKMMLSNDNVYYGFKDHSYTCRLETTNDCPIVYLNHSLQPFKRPCDGIIMPEFPEEAVYYGRNLGASNMKFADEQCEEYVPTIAASDCVYEEDRLNRAMSIPARLGCNDKAAHIDYGLCVFYNVLGVYTAASDYWVDGIDRFVGYYPGCIAHTGGVEESDKFVTLYRDIVRELPENLRGCASMVALDIIRHAQKCVTDEESYMSGIAHRPVIRFEDIDEERAIADARQMKERKISANSFVIPPIEENKLLFVPTYVNNIWEYPYDRILLSKSLAHRAMLATWGERTGAIEVKIVDPAEGKLVWKVLQGDEKKVRIIPVEEDAARVRIEVDYHEAFEAELPDGSKIKTTRVDVGCFCVLEGRASVPCIISFCFSPNETREYGDDGSLKSIDYTRRQIEGWCPWWFAKGTQKDVFKLDEYGLLEGWTRLRKEEDGSVTMNEFSRDGFVVMTRDEFGRPKKVRREMETTWQQALSPTNMYDHARIGMEGHKYDSNERHPENLALLLEYEYEDENDRHGRPIPKVEKLIHKPDLCLRADLSAESGFRLPIIDQMMFGFWKYSSCKYGLMDWWERGDEMVRSDGWIVRRQEGLEPPAKLEKMKFCPWKPGENDRWRIDTEEFEVSMALGMVQSEDGACRMMSVSGPNAGEEYYSLNYSYYLYNEVLEDFAYEELDKEYVRLDPEEVKDVWSRLNPDTDWDLVLIVEGKQISYNDLPEETQSVLAMWWLEPDLYLAILARPSNDFCDRNYVFIRKSPDSVFEGGKFWGLPSKAIGNTVLAALEGDVEALNNYAVLLYCGIASPLRYDEEFVARLLQIAAEKGCETAKHNLEVFYRNKGESKEVGQERGSVTSQAGGSKGRPANESR